MDESDQSFVPSRYEALFRLVLASIAGMVMWRLFQDSALTVAAAESVWWLIAAAPSS